MAPLELLPFPGRRHPFLSAFSNGSLLCVLLSEFSERVEQQMRTQQLRNIVREFQFQNGSASTPLHVLSDHCVV